MKSISCGLIAALLFSTQTFAGLLTTEKSSNLIEKVTLAKSAVAQVEDQSIPLAAIGAGLRSKKVVFVNVKVYVAQLFVSNLEKFNTSEAEALKSIDTQNAVALQLHFLRSVDGETIMKSFKESLAANKVDLESSDVAQGLKAVKDGGEAKEGKTITILGSRLKDKTEAITFETTSGNISKIIGGPGFISKIFSIWLGKPADDNLAQLKKALLTK